MDMRLIAALTACLLAAPTSAQDGFLSGTQRWNGISAPRGDTLMRVAMIDAHRKARRAHGVPPLAWSDALAASARAYARQMAASGRFAHDKQVGVRPQQGENLFKGTRGAFSYELMAQKWVEERKDFRAGRFPDVVRSGDWRKVGHYTQIVWPTTTSFGCATAGNEEEDFLVCRYLPAGNVYGFMLR